MNDQQFLRGLSGGVSVFAIAGAFWFGLGISSLAALDVGWPVWALSMVVQIGPCAGLLWAATRLRRRASLHRLDSDGDQNRRRKETRHLLTAFFSVTAVQAVLIGAAVYWCVSKRFDELIWPSIGLIVSLHFLPFVRIFHVRAYFVTSIAGCAVSLMAYSSLTEPHRLACLSVGMALIMWSTGIYLLLNATRITTTAVQEKWTASSS